LQSADDGACGDGRRSRSPGRGRCISIFLDKNRRYIGKYQSKQAAKKDAAAVDTAGVGVAGACEHPAEFGGTLDGQASHGDGRLRALLRTTVPSQPRTGTAPPHTQRLLANSCLA
jgi:hypothetical protein